MATAEQTNPLLTRLQSLRANLSTNDQQVEKYEEEQREMRARSVLADALIPARFKEASIEDFDPESNVAKYIVWMNARTKPGFKGVFIEGKTGAGKTHAACAIANAFARTGKTVRFTQSVKLLDSAQRLFSESDREFVKRARMASLLVIDDLGKEVVTAKTLPILYSIIDDRYAANRTTIITTNYSASELQRHYESVEPETGLAIMRRISEMTFGMEVTR